MLKDHEFIYVVHHFAQFVGYADEDFNMNDFNVTELTEADQRELTRAANNPMELRNIRRKINNRVASAASRERKQILISELKQRICDLEGLNRTLVDQVCQ